MNAHVDSRKVWDDALASALPDKVLLVGIAYVAEDGSLIEQQEFFGQVQSVHSRDGIRLSLLGRRAGERYNLPPDTRSVHAADPGKYRLRSTGELVVDPDYTVAFSLHKQPPAHDV